jgi:hypothetical protein
MNNYNMYNDPRVRSYLRGNLPSAATIRSWGPGRSGGYGKRYKTKGSVKTSWRRASVVTEKRLKIPRTLKISQKYIDGEYLPAVQSTASYATGAFGTVVSGAAESNRIGNDTRILGLFVTWSVIGGAPGRDCTFRLIIVRYKHGQSNTDPTINQILNTDVNGNYTPLALRNVEKLDDFEILLDEMLFAQHVYSTQTTTMVRNANYKVNCSFVQRYTGTTAASIEMNPMFAYVLCDAPFNTTAGTGQLSIRTVYSDV